MRSRFGADAMSLGIPSAIQRRRISYSTEAFLKRNPPSCATCVFGLSRIKLSSGSRGLRRRAALIASSIPLPCLVHNASLVRFGRTSRKAASLGRLKGIGNAEGPVEGVPEVDIDAFAGQALGMVAVAFILQAGKHVDRIRCHEREPAGDVTAG